MFQFIVSAFAVAVVSILQTTSALFFWGVKPNFALIVLVGFASSEKNWIRRITLVLLSGLILTFAPFATWPDLIFISSALFAVALLDYLPWNRTLNGLVAIVAATVILNLPGIRLNTVLLELVLNIVLALILLPFFSVLYERKKISKKDRF